MESLDRVLVTEIRSSWEETEGKEKVATWDSALRSSGMDYMINLQESQRQTTNEQWDVQKAE